MKKDNKQDGVLEFWHIVSNKTKKPRKFPTQFTSSKGKPVNVTGLKVQNEDKKEGKKE